MSFRLKRRLLSTGAMSLRSPCWASFWKTSFSLKKTSCSVPAAAPVRMACAESFPAASTCTLILGNSAMKRGRACLTHSLRTALSPSR